MTSESNTSTVEPDTEGTEPVDAERDQDGPSFGEWVVLAVCTLGVFFTLYLALQVADISLFSEHAFDAVKDAWTSTATIGLFTALFVAAVVSIFVYVLSKATFLDEDSDPTEQ